MFKKSTTKTKKLLSSIDDSMLKALIDHSKPSNRIKGFEIPEITTWRFCDVMDLTNVSLYEALLKTLTYHTPLKEDQVLDTEASEFVALLKHLKIEFEKIAKLMKLLEKEPDPDLQAAGIHKMNKFGLMGTYYGISQNPLDWQALSELPFSTMFTKMLMDKESGEIKEEYSKIKAEKNKRRK